jgi:hypothetical protein
LLFLRGASLSFRVMGITGSFGVTFSIRNQRPYV